MENKPNYSIVVPSYNEADNLRIILPAIKSSLKNYADQVEILVIDTQKNLDDTETVCSDYSVSYIKRYPSDCYGDAVRIGIENACGKWILFMDADGSHSPSFISEIFAEAKSDHGDVVIASRYVTGGKSENNMLLVLMSKLLNIMYTNILQIKCRDISNSFKLYKADLLKSIKLDCQHFNVVEEIIYKLLRKYPELRIKEIPFMFRKRLHGKSKRNFMIFVFSYFGTLIKFFWQRYFGKCLKGY